MPNINFPKMEEELVKYWKDHHTFERSVTERPINKQYVFYDGPPFATGLPHYGHIVASTIKDVVPRYATMRGFRVERRWGWDCHGLPVENLIEKELGLKTKQDIENIGVDKFNDACKASVLRYTSEWRAVIERLGRWVDMDNDYRTMDTSYTESIWWAFKQLYDQDLIYEGYKAMHLCPRCETTLSNFEVTLGYKNVTDQSVYVQFQLVNEPNMYVIAWTTTPWTLPGNVALAIGPNVDYVKVAVGERYYIVAKERGVDLFRDIEHKVVGSVDNAELVGKRYQPLFPYYKDKKLFKLHEADFVTTAEGTGIVHIAGGFGEDDLRFSQDQGLPIIQHIARNGRFKPEVKDFANEEIKPKANRSATDKKIIEFLQAQDKVFKSETYQHSYPHCWRCDTPLLNYASTAWFVKVTALKERMIKNNQPIHWLPGHIKDGRFGKWLAGAKDWAISRDRYWGAPLPIWQAKDGDIICVGSLAELRDLSGVLLTDVHKQYVDKVEIKRHGKTYKRIPAVLDCWFESGSMPYAQEHYPFAQQEKFLATFPAEFIAEGLDQTRGWFYTLIVLSTALFDKPAFKNVVVNGLVLTEDGKKMSKRLQNYPEPTLIFDKYGADALRFYLMNSPVVRAEDLRFSEHGVDHVMKRLLLTLWNCYTFYETFAVNKTVAAVTKPSDVMDQWILAYLSNTAREITAAMERYDLQPATRKLEELVQEISTWYIRRSRERFKTTSNESALATLRYVLFTTVKLLAPFTPFISERIYLNLQGPLDSVHLEPWPEVPANFTNHELLEQMVTIRQTVEQLLALREQAAIKVRQPLAKATVPGAEQWNDVLRSILAQEVNVKEVVTGDKLELDTTITPQLVQAGMFREIVRAINALRKQQQLTIQDRIIIKYGSTDPVVQAVFQEMSTQLKSSVLANELIMATGELEHQLKVNGVILQVTLIKAP